MLLLITLFALASATCRNYEDSTAFQTLPGQTTCYLTAVTGSANSFKSGSYQYVLDATQDLDKFQVDVGYVSGSNTAGNPCAGFTSLSTRVCGSKACAASGDNVALPNMTQLAIRISCNNTGNNCDFANSAVHACSSTTTTSISPCQTYTGAAITSLAANGGTKCFHNVGTGTAPAVPIVSGSALYYLDNTGLNSYTIEYGTVPVTAQPNLCDGFVAQGVTNCGSVAICNDDLKYVTVGADRQPSVKVTCTNPANCDFDQATSNINVCASTDATIAPTPAPSSAAAMFPVALLLALAALF